MQLLLNKNELLDLGTDLRLVSIHCQEGYCWLTQTGDNQDHILHAGQSHTFTQRGKVLVTAMMESRLELIAEPKGAVSTSFWRLFFRHLFSRHLSVKERQPLAQIFLPNQ